MMNIFFLFGWDFTNYFYICQSLVWPVMKSLKHPAQIKKIILNNDYYLFKETWGVCTKTCRFW